MTSPNSSAGAVAAAAARLRAEGARLRERSRADVVASLGAVLDSWRDGEGHWQRELAPQLAASSGFSEANVRRGLREALEPWSGDALREVVAGELGESDASGHELTSVLLAGCIPMPTLLQILLVLAVRSPALVKMASRDTVTARLVRASLEAADPQLARCVEVLEPEMTEDPAARAVFLSSSCLVASGSDETIDSVRAEMSPEQTVVEYGHRLSVAVIGSDAFDRPTAAALASDVAAWDQLGCLSPAVAFAILPASGAEDGAGSSKNPDAPDDALHRFAELVASELERLEREAPRGAIDAATASAIRTERETARLRFATARPQLGRELSRGREPEQAQGRTPGLLLASAGTEWTVLCEADEGADASLRPAPLHRFLRIQPVRDVAALERLSRPLAPWLSTLACAGLSGEEEAAVARLGGHRLCRPGEMQTPELGWQRDGLPLLRTLIL